MTDFCDSKYYKMFKAYDMRGTVPELTADVYYWVGFALVEKILKPEDLPLEVCTMHDARTSSPDFYQAFCNGVEAAGGKGLPLGIGSSDLLYAASLLFNKPGAMITASHNPKEYNGVKIVKETPQMIGLDSGLDIIRDFVIEKIEEGVDFEVEDVQNNEEKKDKLLKFFDSKLQEIGSIDETDKKLSQKNRKLKIVVDAANGMGGMVMERLKDMYQNVEFVPLYWEPDGTFPNHPADPTEPENLIELKELIGKENADLGAALDGDGDRCVLIDENGRDLPGDFLVAIMAKYAVTDARSNPQKGLNPVAVFPQTNSRCIAEQILEADGGAIPTKQGHTFIKRDMAKYNAVYGGEASGHHYFGEFGCMDSGILNIAMIIKILAESGLKASELDSHLKERYYLSGERNYRLEGGLTLEKVVEEVKKSYSDGAISQIDGILVTYPDWRLSIRSSNTEPLLRFNIECRGNTENNNPEQKLEEVLKIVGIK